MAFTAAVAQHIIESGTKPQSATKNEPVSYVDVQLWNENIMSVQGLYSILIFYRWSNMWD